jgi:hypothetical protein
LASGRRNTRQNLDGKQITPATDPENILKARGSLKPTAAVYKLKTPPLKTKSSSKPSTSLSPLFDTKVSMPNCSEVRSEFHPTVPLVHKGKGPFESSSDFDIPSFLQLNFPTSPNSEECVTHLVSTPIGSPDFASCKFEEPIPHIPYLSSLDFPLREENKESLLILQNPLYNFPQIAMAVSGGGGGGFVGGGGRFIGGGGGRSPSRRSWRPRAYPPSQSFCEICSQIFSLSISHPSTGPSRNYIKKLPKFMGEGDLTAVEHINFFDQFADFLGIEHEDVYSRIFVQTFEGRVRTWFRILPATSILSYDTLEDAFLRQWGERKDHLYYLTEFGSLRKKNSETVMEFIQRFNKLYNKIPVEVKPSQPTAKVTFVEAFEPDFALLL